MSRPAGRGLVAELGRFVRANLASTIASGIEYKGAVHHEGLRYLAVSGTSLALNLAGSYALVDGLGLPAVPGVIAASLVVGFTWNYPLHRYYVFRTSPLATAARS